DGQINPDIANKGQGNDDEKLKSNEKKSIQDSPCSLPVIQRDDDDDDDDDDHDNEDNGHLMSNPTSTISSLISHAQQPSSPPSVTSPPQPQQQGRDGGAAESHHLPDEEEASVSFQSSVEEPPAIPYNPELAKSTSSSSSSSSSSSDSSNDDGGDDSEDLDYVNAEESDSESSQYDPSQDEEPEAAKSQRPATKQSNAPSRRRRGRPPSKKSKAPPRGRRSSHKSRNPDVATNSQLPLVDGESDEDESSVSYEIPVLPELETSQIKLPKPSASIDIEIRELPKLRGKGTYVERGPVAYPNLEELLVTHGERRSLKSLTTSGLIVSSVSHLNYADGPILIPHNMRPDRITEAIASANKRIEDFKAQAKKMEDTEHRATIRC
ncbi:MAG TPA: hypothetical protein VHN59_19265, partial [Chitinophagaceae bacterium]|nr:hypothetical protein [Chitinophagaceae bacterium]